MNWTARVEWTQYTPSNDTELAELVDRLAPLAGAIGVEKESAGPGYPETWGAVVTLEAATLRQATVAALQHVEQAIGQKATGVEVLATHEHDRRVLQPSIPELVGYAEIAEMAGVTRQRAAQLGDVIGFPAAVVETKAGPLRVKSQVARWLSRWERKPGRPPKATQ